MAASVYSWISFMLRLALDKIGNEMSLHGIAVSRAWAIASRSNQLRRLCRDLGGPGMRPELALSQRIYCQPF